MSVGRCWMRNKNKPDFCALQKIIFQAGRVVGTPLAG
jgi:hypothetical protein